MSEEDQVEAAEVKELVTLLQYQDAAVVSRVLLKHSAGSVTLFAFDKGEGISEQTAPFDALVAALDGEADIEMPARISRCVGEKP
jgi:quercetin dioxygenase-like cupin family protein